MLSAVGEEVENPSQRGLLETSQIWEELHPQLVSWAAMWASHQVQMPQKSALKSAGVHADTVWNKGRYLTSLSLSLNMHIDIRARRSGLLRRSGFNKTASEGELEGSNPNVNFPTFCECLLMLTLNPLEQSLVPPHQRKVKANLTREWAPEPCVSWLAHFQQFTSNSLVRIDWRENLKRALQNSSLCLSYSVNF